MDHNQSQIPRKDHIRVHERNSTLESVSLPKMQGREWSPTRHPSLGEQLWETDGNLSGVVEKNLLKGL